MDGMGAPQKNGLSPASVALLQGNGASNGIGSGGANYLRKPKAKSSLPGKTSNTWDFFLRFAHGKGKPGETEKQTDWERLYSNNQQDRKRSYSDNQQGRERSYSNNQPGSEASTYDSQGFARSEFVEPPPRQESIGPSWNINRLQQDYRTTSLEPRPELASVSELSLARLETREPMTTNYDKLLAERIQISQRLEMSELNNSNWSTGRTDAGPSPFSGPRVLEREEEDRVLTAQVDDMMRRNRAMNNERVSTGKSSGPSWNFFKSKTKRVFG
jgi:hypothetical protein